MPAVVVVPPGAALEDLPPAAPEPADAEMSLPLVDFVAGAAGGNCPGPAAPREHRGEAPAPRHPVIPWTHVPCLHCGNARAGDIKLDPAPGGRPPVWVMRVPEADGSWPTQGARCPGCRACQLGLSERLPAQA